VREATMKDRHSPFTGAAAHKVSSSSLQSALGDATPSQHMFAMRDERPDAGHQLRIQQRMRQPERGRSPY